MNRHNINTSSYWNDVYRREWRSGAVLQENYSRDYGPIHDAIIDLIPTGSDILDIACGPGILCRKLKRRIDESSVTGIDFSSYAIERNRGVDEALGIRYEVVDISASLAQITERFDVVTMCEILEHLDDPERIVDEAMGLLRPGGLFILTCPHKDGIPDPEHVRIWDHDELFHLLSKYSPTVSFTHFPPPWFHVWMMAHLTKDIQPEHEEGCG